MSWNLTNIKKAPKSDTDLTAADLKVLTEKFKDVTTQNGFEFPQEPFEQLELAIEAVFKILEW